jgi:hypothetical protein
VPILVATEASDRTENLVWGEDGVAEPVLCNAKNLNSIIQDIASKTPKQEPLSGDPWAAAGYKPTPTIIQAAQALYRGHQVEEITRSDAGAKNLTRTAACIAQTIEKSKARRQKAICFLTGVPGAGKTLAGLNLVNERTKAHGDEHAVFLSGNGPLVDVLREALARDEQARVRDAGGAIRKAEAERKVKSFIQNIHHFRDANLRTDEAPPIERVAVFDEAQRAWDRDHTANFMKQRKGVPDFDRSEPEFLISVMDRHSDWCTIVCLIGGGQEINAGEAGLTEWFRALQSRFPDWKVYTSPQLAHRDYHWGHDFEEMLRGLQFEKLDDLHLAVSVRSFRAEKLSDFVGAVVAGEASEARTIFQDIKASYPIVLTRDLEEARAWLRARARGTERYGLVASAGALRLKPGGVNVRAKIDATYWFLNDKTDVRSSFYVEDVATQFDIQGLELDWVGVCWDADYRRVNGRWAHYRFRGTSWDNVNDQFQKAYLANAYRVLLTRARQGMVIYVPEGSAADPTRPLEYYEGVAGFLAECGINPIGAS